MGPSYPETCNRCGGKVIFVVDSEIRSPGEALRWVVINADGSAIHKCGAKVKVKVYTEEEKREFERKRLAGAV
jgi:hypothetical protein